MRRSFLRSCTVGPVLHRACYACWRAETECCVESDHRRGKWHCFLDITKWHCFFDITKWHCFLDITKWHCFLDITGRAWVLTPTARYLGRGEKLYNWANFIESILCCAVFSVEQDQWAKVLHLDLLRLSTCFIQQSWQWHFVMWANCTSSAAQSFQ